LNKLIEIESKSSETIAKTIHRFAVTTSLLSILSMIAYLFMGYYYLAFSVALIGLLFCGVIYLNKKSMYSLARVTMILAANIGVFLFSTHLGFKSGIFLYIFACPQLIYLAFHVNQKSQILISLIISGITFVSIFIVDYYKILNSIHLNPNELKIIYGINFISSFIFTVMLIRVFATNNENYIEMLKTANISLEGQQLSLQNEIDEKIKINLELEKSITEKEMLLSEVHHRVKNNLAVISGLLDLENLFVKEKSTSDILKDSKNRIKSIALLHEKLYKHDNLDRIDIKSYIKELIYFVQLSYSNDSKEIEINANIDSIEFNMETALPFSLFINELITNSYKHAFKEGENGIISLKLDKIDNSYIFEYTDNGIGYNINQLQENDSIGINLLNAFTEQLEGKLTDNTIEGKGCNISLQFIDIE
jgi:two-component sensor histidine kinase